jgi:hypothetical protein
MVVRIEDAADPQRVNANSRVPLTLIPSLMSCRMAGKPSAVAGTLMKWPEWHHRNRGFPRSPSRKMAGF